MAGDTRPVRVTIVGEGRPLVTDGTLMRLESLAGVLLIDTKALDVSVEYLDPERTWTDGDAVASGGTVLTRCGGKWHQVTEHGVSTAYDPDVSMEVLAGKFRVLRYQAGGDA
jgi:hypothetical protein